MITGSPTAGRMNAAPRTKHGDRARRKSAKYNPYKDISGEKGCPVTTEYEIDRYLCGWQERYFETPSGGTEKRLVYTVIDAVTKNPKYNNRTGPRRHHQPQTLRSGNGVYIVPRYATEIISRKERKAKKEKAERKGFSVTIGEDGCTNVAVRSHLTRYGYTTKNKHSAKNVPTQIGAGTVGVKVSNANDWELVDIKLEKIGRTKWFNAIAQCRNPVARLTKTIIIERIRSKAVAIVKLKTVHNIKC